MANEVDSELNATITGDENGSKILLEYFLGDDGDFEIPEGLELKFKTATGTYEQLISNNDLPNGTFRVEKKDIALKPNVSGLIVNIPKNVNNLLYTKVPSCNNRFKLQVWKVDTFGLVNSNKYKNYGVIVESMGLVKLEEQPKVAPTQNVNKTPNQESTQSAPTNFYINNQGPATPSNSGSSLTKIIIIIIGILLVLALLIFGALYFLGALKSLGNDALSNLPNPQVEMNEPTPPKDDNLPKPEDETPPSNEEETSNVNEDKASLDEPKVEDNLDAKLDETLPQEPVKEDVLEVANEEKLEEPTAETTVDSTSSTTNSACSLSSDNDNEVIKNCLASKPDTQTIISFAKEAFEKDRCNIGKRIFTSFGRNDAVVSKTLAAYFDPNQEATTKCLEKNAKDARYWYEKSLQKEANQDVKKALQTLGENK